MTGSFGDLLSTVAPDLRRSILLTLDRTENAAVLAGVANLLGDPNAGVAEAAEDALVRQASAGAARAAAAGLLSSGAAERARAMGVLARLGDHATAILLSLVSSPDADVRKYAIDTLGASRTPAPGVVTVLVTLLGDSDVVIAGAAAEALGNLRAADAVPALAACLGCDDLWVRPAAIDALARIGGAAAFAAIAGLPRNAPGPVAAAAVHALARSGSVDPDAAVRHLAEFLRHPSPQVADDALLAIGGIVDVPDRGHRADDRRGALAHATAAAAAARRALTHRDPALRRAGAVVLARGVAGLVDFIALNKLLAGDPNADVRAAALLALAAHGHLDAQALGATAADRGAPEAVRCAAAQALASRPDASGEQILIELISKGRGDVELRVAIAVASLDRQSSRCAAITWLHDAWEELDDPEAAASAMATASSNAAALASAVLDTCQGELRGRLFSAVLRPTDARSFEEATHVVLRAIADTDRTVRTHALRLVAAGVPGPFEPAIRLALKDPDARARVRAMEALRLFPNAADDQAVVLAARADTSGWVRAAAVAAASSRGSCGLDYVLAAQADDFAPVRHAALEAALRLVQAGSARPASDALLRLAVRAQSDDDESMADLGRQLEALLS